RSVLLWRRCVEPGGDGDGAAGQGLDLDGQLEARPARSVAEPDGGADHDAELVRELLPGPALRVDPLAELAAACDRATHAALAASHGRVIAWTERPPRPRR